MTLTIDGLCRSNPRLPVGDWRAGWNSKGLNNLAEDDLPLAGYDQALEKLKAASRGAGAVVTDEEAVYAGVARTRD
jgi:hypothetical protein